MKRGQQRAQLGSCDGLQIDVCVVGAGRAVNLAAAAQPAAVGHERVHK